MYTSAALVKAKIIENCQCVCVSVCLSWWHHQLTEKVQKSLSRSNVRVICHQGQSQYI